MKKVVRILLAILMVTALALGITACKSDCDKGNHKWDEGTVTTSATCTQEGVKTFKCTVCDLERTESIAKTAHTPVSADVEATCTTSGKTGATKCSVCNTAIAAGTTIPAKGHTVAAWTDASNGKHSGLCSVCEETITENHVANEAGDECTKCHAALGGGNEDPCAHPDKTFTTQAATCTTAEVKHWTCPDCDWTSDETVGEPLGHDYTGRTWTATTDGSQHQMACTRQGCNYVKTEDHTPVKVDGFAASCTAAGKEDGSKCSVCNHVISVGAEIPKNPHDYEGQAWKTASGKHYQECANGCGARNEHNAAMGTYQKVGDNHVSTCSVQGCTIKSEHAADFGDWTITETSHYRQCTHTGCTFKTEVGDHDQNAIENKNTTQHTVACSACGKTYPDANHVWGEFSVTKEPTCTVEGIKTRTCACGATDTDTIDTIDHTESYENTEDERIVTCSVCGTELDRIEHVFEWYDGDRQEHYKKCETCDYILESTRAGHNYTTNPEEFVCSVCGRIPEDVIVSVYYNGTYTSKDTLADAIAFITDDSAATIYLGESLEGAGIVIPENRNITLRMLGNTYTVTSAANGDNGIVLSKGSTVRILNGTITTAENSGVTTLVANYANLTLTNATLDGTKLDAVSDGHNYTLRSYFGTTSMTSSTIKAATATEYALDVLYGTADDYMDGVSVTVGASSVINGYVRYGSQAETTDWSKVVLRLRSAPNYLIHFSCDVDCDTVNIKKVNTSTGEEAQLAHRKDQDWTHDETAVSHYHLCTRCGAHTDEASCALTKETVAGKPATCTQSGLTDGEKCSVCGTVLVARTTINALGHNYDETIEGHVMITKPATCTEDGTKTVQCSRCAVTEERTIDALGHDEYKAGETAATCTADKVEHWACTRCSWTENKTIEDTALGHNLVKESETAATCTTAQINHMKCSRCDYTEDQTEGNALGHNWATAWTAVDALQHAHLCQREGCEATDGATSHTYTANHCGDCDRTITESEILTALGSLGSGAYLCGQTSTFTLTGVITKVDYAYTESNGASVTMQVGGESGKSIYCFKMKGSNVVALQNIQVGDTITVLGKITNYQGNKLEFDQGCTLEGVVFKDEAISVSYNSEQVEVSTIATKAERYSEITFTVTAKDGFKVDSVKLNGQTLTPQGGEYKFTVTTENVIEIASSSANALPAHNDPAQSSSGTVVIDINSVGGSDWAISNYNHDGTNTGTFAINGIEFTYTDIAKANATYGNGLQVKATTKFNNTTAFPGVITKVTVVYNSGTANGRTLAINVASDAEFNNAQPYTITNNKNDSEVVSINVKDGKYISFAPAGGASYIVSITIEYGSETPCVNSKDPVHHNAVTESCTTNGTKEYWQCADCGKYFVKNEEGKYVETTLADVTIAAHHTLTKVEASAPTCTEAGNSAHWACSVCGAKFTDENGTTPIDNVTINAIGHNYTYTSNNDGTHTGICQNNNSHVDANVACTSETWKHDATNHWKVCDVCNVKFGETAHTGDACTCGALKLTYKVYNELYYGQDDKEEIVNHDLTVTMQTYAAAGDAITVTATSQKYEVITVVSGVDDFTKSSGSFSGTVAVGGIIEIYVKTLSSAKYVGATVNGAAEGDISVTATVDGTELENNAVLAEGNVISIAVMYYPDDYIITVTVTQGSSVINQEITLGDYDEEAMTATGTYTCAAKGDVSITVTARAKYKVTIPTIENVTLTVKKVVEGGEAAISSGDTVLADDIIKVEAAPATNYQVVEGSLKVNGTQAVTGGYKVTGDVTIEVELAKKVTVNITANSEADIEVTVGGEKVDGEIYITGETTLTITVTAKQGVNKDVDKVTVNGIEQTASDGKYAYKIDAGAAAGSTFVVAATLKDKPAEAKVVYALNSSTFKTGSNSSYTGNCDVTIDDITWNIEGNAQMNPWRFGGKSITNTDRKLTSKTAIADNVSKIIIGFTDGGSITVNSVTLKVYKSNPTSGSPTPVATKSLTYKKDGSVTVEREDNEDWSNCYYQVIFNVTIGGSNKYVAITSMEFYA